MANQISSRVPALISTLVANIDWAELTEDAIDRILRDPKQTGRHSTMFLVVGARMPLGELKIATAPFNVTTFLGEKWKLLADEQDQRSQKLLEVDFSKADFLHCLNEKELKDGTSIKGEERFLRLKKEKNRIRYGVTVFMGLWEDYQVHKQNSVLERLYKDRGITYLDFFGDVLEGPDGGRHVLVLYRRDDGTWYWYYRWLDDGWGARHVSVVSLQAS